MTEILDNSVNSPFASATHYACSISDSLSLKVHSSTNPQNMKIADLQKGLVLLCNGIDVVGEGIGFGVPIAKYSDETVFSGSSLLYIRKEGTTVEIQKKFFMDLIARYEFRNLKLENRKIRRMFDFFSVLYQRHDRFVQSSLFAKDMIFKFGLTSAFIKSSPRGVVAVTYVLDRNRIQVKLDLSLLERNKLDKVFILNEQGAHFFRTYSDSEGLKLVDDEIGAWNNVTAQSAKIANERSRIGFTLKSIEGVTLRRGRELMKSSLDWIGLDYEVKPEYSQFEYEIELFG